MDKELYQLGLEGGACLGIFTSPEKAIEYVYWTDVYRVYRGWSSEIDTVVWIDAYGNGNLYGYTPDLLRYRKEGFIGEAKYHIYLVAINGTAPVLEELRLFREEKNLPKLNDVMEREDAT